MKVDAEGNYYWPETPFSEFFSGNKKVYKGVPNQGSQGELTEYEMTTDRPTTGFALDPSRMRSTRRSLRAATKGKPTASGSITTAATAIRSTGPANRSTPSAKGPHDQRTEVKHSAC